MFLIFIYKIINNTRWNFDDHTPAANFNRFPIAMLTVFQVGLLFFFFYQKQTIT
jgi:hypothetical protein